jgi:hypothetical protein
MYDVEAAFLNAEPGHKHYIFVPEGMIRTGMMKKEEAAETALELTKSMYGNVDTALRFFVKYKGILQELGMEQCKSDPCVFHWQDEEGFLELMIAYHVDDSGIAGQKSVIDRYYTTNERGTPRACEVCETFTHLGPEVGH